MRGLLLFLICCSAFAARAGQSDAPCSRAAKINYDGIYKMLEYPEFVINNDIYSFVTINGLLDTNGYFQDLYVKESYCELLNSEAFDAVRKVRHVPPRKNCRNLSERLDVTVFFLAGESYPKRTPVQHIRWNYDKAFLANAANKTNLYYQRGMQFFKMGEDSLAKADYIKASAESNGDDLPYFDELIYERIQQYLPAVSVNADSMLMRFGLLRSNFLYQKALETLDTMIFRPNADFVRLLQLRGALYCSWKKYEYAVEDYQMAYQLDTAKSFILHYIGNAYYAAGKYDSAMYYSLLSFGKDSTSVASVLQYALAKLRAGYVDDAKSLFAKWMPVAKKERSGVIVNEAFLSLQRLLFDGFHTEAVEEILEKHLGIERSNFWQLW